MRMFDNRKKGRNYPSVIPTVGAQFTSGLKTTRFVRCKGRSISWNDAEYELGGHTTHFADACR